MKLNGTPLLMGCALLCLALGIGAFFLEEGRRFFPKGAC